MPVLLDHANEGQSENGIGYERVIHRIKPPIQAGCPALWNYLQARLKEAQRKSLLGA